MSRDRLRKIKPQVKEAGPLVPAPSYVPTPEEMPALAAHLEHHAKVPVVPRVGVTMKDGVSLVAHVHENQNVGNALLMHSLGAADIDFYRGLLLGAADAVTQNGKTSEDNLNFALSVAREIKPRDGVEAMLATQMAAIHLATMKAAKRLNHVENLKQLDSNSNALNKVARTFAAQVDALKRYRSTGQQIVTVQHVNVADGGQAIVGTVNHGGGVADKDDEATS